MKLIPVIVAALCLFEGDATVGQTIHKDQLGCFAGRIRLYGVDGKDLFLVEKFDSSYVTQPCWSQFEEPRLQKHPFSSYSIWIANPVGTRFQDELLCWSGMPSGRVEDWMYLRWFMFLDYMGGDLQRNVLTAWRKKGDSLQFQCGQRGPFDTKSGLAVVRRVTVFPDSSLLLVVEELNYDYGEWVFLRGTSPCDFEPFYRLVSENERRDGEFFTRTEFVVGPLQQPRYLVECVKSRCAYRDVPNFDGGSENLLHIFNTLVDTVDVWRLAVEHFHIDTLLFPRK